MTTRPKGKKHDVSLFPAPDSVVGQHYYYVTQRPWPSLVFVFPMLLVFEVGTWARHPVGAFGGSPLVASYLIERLVTSLGGAYRYPQLLGLAPGLLMIAILLAWHVAARHPWRFDVNVLAGMLGESIFWTLPLFVFGRLLQQAELAGTPAERLQWADSLIRSFGAGIYEELVFRLICITLLVLIFIDTLRLPRTPAAVFIMIGSAVLFAAQHHPPLGAEPFSTQNFLFRAAAGLYLAGLFVFRGFGIAAGCHAFYNVIVVTIAAV